MKNLNGTSGTYINIGNITFLDLYMVDNFFFDNPLNACNQRIHINIIKNNMIQVSES